MGSHKTYTSVQIINYCCFYVHTLHLYCLLFIICINKRTYIYKIKY